jgi:KipI family sensor histidine kinase inhibitor
VVTIRAASDRALLISFGEEISAEAREKVARLTGRLLGAPGILNLHPAYASVVVDFDPRRHAHGEIEELVRQRWNEAASGPSQAAPPRVADIPVVYGGAGGPDLAFVAAHTGLAAERVVELHSSAEYVVCFLGFLPGFPYLAGLPPELETPRMDAPRTRVPAGSVAIGGRQTGIYPMESPGGWRIVGRTPMRLFDAGADPPAALAMGGRVRFVPIPEARF